MFGLMQKIFLKLIGGSRNERLVRKYANFVHERINPLEDQMRALSDEKVLERSNELRSRMADGENRDNIKAEAFALVREASRRAQNHRQFDVQLVAGMILDEGWIAEEATGEGKTIACYPAIYMAVLEGLKAHVITTNDYLVKRDAAFARPIFEMLGVSVGRITAGMDNTERQAEYACDVTYGTNSEFGFDYLRDNMKLSTSEQVQGQLGFAIVDEVDSILIDEARTPLIISGPAYGQTDRYAKVDSISRDLVSKNRPWDRANSKVESLHRELKALSGELSKAKGDKAKNVEKQIEQTQAQLVEAEAHRDQEVKYFEVELDKKSAHMTHEGVSTAQEIAGVGSFYVGANMEWPHLMEQSLRAHLVYERDKDYVVQNGEVIIVDEFTGRLMVGRQWSDGLHQAVEAKERVTVKEETQTLATITIQNYFKLYKKLAGMTGTAMTEADEFMKIYELDVVSVTTHRPVNRMDHNDRIFGEVDGKYSAVVEEINNVSKRGRPVLVGTTSIEKSEKISNLLQHRYGVEHQVLNGRIQDADLEGEIVKNAGQRIPIKPGAKELVGMVTIATNMAGRGTDIKLGDGVVWKNCHVPGAEKFEQLGVEMEELFPAGTNKCCICCTQYDPSTNCGHCFKPKIDPDFPSRGKGACRQEVPCGLHIVGTERHEARRIDNQLRGRAGRQGDPGSSRFFISLRDDLMAIFAGPWTLKVLSWLGLQGDMAIEDRRISKGIARAQKKVEERNFEIRKNLLEYDEVMDFQRHGFYSRRQAILDGQDLEGVVLDMVLESVDEAVGNYIEGDYVQRCIAEWARQTLQIPVREEQISVRTLEELGDLEDKLKEIARDEAASNISMTLGEYMDPDMEAGQWDLRGLSSWAMSRFNVNISQNQLRKMNPQEVEQELTKSAFEIIDHLDVTPAGRFLREDFPQRSMAEWVKSSFNIELTPEELTGSAADAREAVGKKVDQAYQRREIEYPVVHAIEMTIAQAGTENVYALENLVKWVNHKFNEDFTTEDFRGRKLEDIHYQLVSLCEQWNDGDKLEELIRDSLGEAPDMEPAIEFAKNRFDIELSPEDFNGDVFDRLLQAGKSFLRREMTRLEQFVLLQIYDSSWKDHLLAMDHLKSGIGLRSYAEQDPRLAFKREGSRMFHEMLDGIREKVTDMIFKVRLSAGAEMSNVYQISNTVHEQMAGYERFTRDAADQQAAMQPKKVETIMRDAPKVGRNDPCPCGSGKKYKKCCGKNT